MRHCVSFDIDGTLINTEELNKRAYKLVGIDMPDYAWGLRWQTWLIDIVGSKERAMEVHTSKVHAYAELLRDVKISNVILEPTYIAREMIRRPDIQVQFLTAGTTMTANIILQRLGLRPTMAGNLSYEARRLALHSTVLGSNGAVVYLDDNPENIRRLAEDVPLLSVIHYTGQTANELRTKVQDEFLAKS